MGEVWSATHLITGKQVALKLLPVSKHEAPNRFRRFLREARAAGMAEHPNIVSVHDAFELEDGTAVMVLDLVKGKTLRAVLDERGPLELSDACDIMLQIVAGVAAVHEVGVIHRDLKPDNVLVSQDGGRPVHVRVVDFGIARLIENTDSPLASGTVTEPGRAVGTPGYMSPEQAEGDRALDHRTDVWSIGVMLYEMLAHRHPFRVSQAMPLGVHVVPIEDVCPGLPRDVVRLVASCLAHDPKLRPRNLKAVYEALLPHASESALAYEQAIAAGYSSEVRSRSSSAGGEGASSPQIQRQREPAPEDVFVGRVPELGALVSALHDASGARGRVILISGEPGIGKSALVKQLSLMTTEQGCTCYSARCSEVEGAPAYWPWIQVLRAASASLPRETRDQLIGSASPIARLVPELAETMREPRAVALDPAQERFKLFDSIARFLEALALRAPTVITIDDLHCADPASFLLLEFLANHALHVPLVLVATYRELELARDEAKANLVARLRRGSASRSLALSGLSDNELGAFLEAATGERPGSEVLASLWQSTAGNPFFLNQLVRLPRAKDGAPVWERASRQAMRLPRGVREAIVQQLEGLPEECHELLRLASVIGRDFSMSVLQVASGLPQERVWALADLALRAGILVEEPGSATQRRFSHLLVRDALYDELSPIERATQHQRVARALEAQNSASAGSHAAELSHHFHEAMMVDGVERALRYAVAAGDAARQTFAFEQASLYYERGIVALEQAPTMNRPRLLELLLAQAEAQTRAGQRDRGRETFQRAARLARELGAPQRLAQVALGLAPGFFAIETGILDPMLVELLEEALSALQTERTPLKAQVAARLAIAIYWSDEAERRRQLIAEAEQLARSSEDALTTALVQTSKHASLWTPENLNQRLFLSEQTASYCERHGMLELALLNRVFRVTDLLENGAVDQARLEIDVFEQTARDANQPHYEWYTGAYRGMLALAEGDFEETERLAHRYLPSGQRLNDHNATETFGVHLTLVHLERGRAAELLGLLHDYRAKYPRVVGWTCLLTNALARSNQVASAKMELESLSKSDFEIPRDMNYLTSIAWLCEAVAIAGDPSQASALVDRMAPYADRCITIGYGIAILGSGHRYAAIAAARAGQAERARHHFEQALSANRDMGLPVYLVHTQCEFAKFLAGTGNSADEARAHELTALALRAANRLKAGELVSIAKAQYRRLDTLG